MLCYQEMNCLLYVPFTRLRAGYINLIINICSLIARDVLVIYSDN
jgi:hypothetical protein